MGCPQRERNPPKSLQSHGEQQSMKSSHGSQEPIPGHSPLWKVSEPVPTMHNSASFFLADTRDGSFLYNSYPSPFSSLWSSFRMSQSETPEPENSLLILKNCHSTGKTEHLIFLSLKLLSPQTLFCFALSLPIDKRRGSAKALTLLLAGLIKTHLKASWAGAGLSTPTESAEESALPSQRSARGPFPRRPEEAKSSTAPPA